MHVDYLKHHGIKGQKWGVRRTPEELGHKNYYTKSNEDGTIHLEDIRIGKSVGAKRKTIFVEEPRTGMRFSIVEGSAIRNPTVFAGYGTSHPLKEETVEGLMKEYPGSSYRWQHLKGIATLDYFGEEREAEIHWFYEKSVGADKWRVKYWND